MRHSFIGVLSVVCLFLLSCIISPPPPNSKKRIFLNKSSKIFSKIRKSYINLKLTLFMKRCDKNKKICLTGTGNYSASGVVVAKNHIMTAGHFCYKAKIKKTITPMGAFEVVAKTIVIRELSGKIHINSKIVSFIKDPTRDMCLIFVPNLDVRHVSVSKEAPLEGDTIYNVGSPYGIYYPNLVPMFRGIFLGNNRGRSFYTLHATSGSSGSMIVNSSGELVGIVTHTLNKNKIPLTLGPKFKTIIDFLRSYVAN